MKKYASLFLFIIGCELVGIVGSFFTVEAIPGWYAGLSKPFFSPPNWVFGPVWTILYAMMGVAVWLVWMEERKSRRTKKPKNKKIIIMKSKALKLFGWQLLANFWWSIIFFGWKSPGWALVNILMMWILIGLTVRSFWQVDKRAAYLMVPYWLWVSFATVLNGAIVVLN